MQTIALIALGYIFGSLSSAIIISRALGLPDPRTEGSGNPGATNMARTGGKKAAAMTLFGDLTKGLVPVLIAKGLGAELEAQLLVALAALLGHLYPVFFRFQGGKGVATALGVLFGLQWQIALAWLVTWLAVFTWKKVSSLSALTATALVPLYIWIFSGSLSFVVFGIVITILIYWRHRTNIEELLAGTED